MKRERDNRHHWSFSWLPNTVTLFNLFTGFLAILMVTEKRFDTAGWLVFIALFWDSIDGNVARAFKNCTPLGKELDSLADIVSFIVAPALIAAKSWHYAAAPWTLGAVFLYLAAGAYRLARFNVQPASKYVFEGLPTPAAAVTLSMTVLAYRKNAAAQSEHFALILFFLTILISFLMVSHISYPKLSAINFSRWKSLFVIAFFLFSACLFIRNIETALALVLFLFIVLAPAYSFPLRAAEHEDTEGAISKLSK